jgi:16S rRNA (guanine(966)-N(2))-methyltransferase RsmD
MRIISGAARGRRLREPSGFDIRPTTDLVKEAIFDILQFDMEGRRVLDLFAGTGQLGVEALSRGAGFVVFVDSNPQASKLIGENLGLCGFAGSAEVLTRDALRYLKGCEPFDIIIADPPYDTSLAGEALQRIIGFDKLANNGIIICETKTDWVTPDIPPPYHLRKTYKYGRTMITRIERSGAPQAISNR